MTSQIWFSNKNDLMKSIPKGDPLILLSKDVDTNSAKKHFTSFRCARDMIKFLDDARTSKSERDERDMVYSEIIPNMNDFSTFMFFDLDKYLDDRDENMAKDMDEYCDTVLSVFLQVLERFLKQVYKIDIRLKIGDNLHITTACSSTKFSAHVRVNILCSNLLNMKTIANNLLAYTLSNTCTSKEERDFLTYTDATQSADPLTKTLVDQAIYTNFRSFRTLFSTKLKGVPRPLTPYKDSSHDFNDHLVCVYDTNVDHAVARIDSDVGFKAYADFSQASGVTFRKPYTTHNAQTNENLTVTEIPISHINMIHKNLEKSDKIKALLKTNVFDCHTEIYQDHTNTYNFYFQGYHCPFSQKIHRSNRSYFQYNYTKRCLYYKCFNAHCRVKEKNEGSLRIDLDIHLDSLTRLADINNIDTLHCKDSVITWNECYNEPDMRKYPIVPICCVRGNMGTGKTKAIVREFLPELCKKNKELKCLFITYQRLLSVKYLEELGHLGFVNYLDIENHDILDKKVIVCLDSLQRVKATNFDFIFIDEATSVFTHFNSEHMKGTQFICLQLEVLLLQAKHLYFLDACVDNNIVQEVVDYISKKKNTPCYFVKNEYIRPSNRDCILHTNTCGSNRKKFHSLAMNTILEKVQANKRVVVACSTKSSAVKFDTMIRAFLDSNMIEKRVLLYHSDSEQKITKHNIHLFSQLWMECDILIYSPTITAGVSFEFPHFHSLVAYMENSFYTPTIDLLLQQVFRVRQLIDGDMHIFSHDSIDASNNYKYPMTKYEMDEKLSDDVHRLGFYYGNKEIKFEKPLHINAQGIVEFDKEKLSYKILRSILMNINKSRNNFTKLLRTTLTKDYAIECEDIEFDVQKNRAEIDTIETIIKASMALTVEEDESFVFDDGLLINSFQHDELTRRKKRDERLNPREITQKWIFDCAGNLWGLHHADKEFFDTYIKLPSKSNIKSSITKYFCYRRIHEFLMHPDDDFTQRLRDKMDSIANRLDHTFPLKKVVLNKEYYRTLLDGQVFLNSIVYPIVPDYQQMLIEGKSVTMDHSEFDASMMNFFASHARSMEKFCDTFNIKFTPDLMPKLLEQGRYNQRSRTFIAKNVLDQAFSIEVRVDSGKRKTDTSFITLSSQYFNIKSRYKPCFMNDDNQISQEFGSDTEVTDDNERVENDEY